MADGIVDARPPPPPPLTPKIFMLLQKAKNFITADNIETMQLKLGYCRTHRTHRRRQRRHAQTNLDLEDLRFPAVN